MNAVTEFDVGPLTWVKSEIDLALERAAQALDQFSAGAASGTEDLTQIRYCRTHLHQVQGALTIVGLDGVTQFSEAVESMLEAIEQQTCPANKATIGLARQALSAIGHYLTGLVNGQPNQPLRLLSLYREVQTARGVQRFSAADLFFPDLSVRPPRSDSPTKKLASSDWPRFLKQERARFQRGLLAWLRTPQEKSGVKEMLASVRRIEETQDTGSARSFWWVAGGFLTALAEGKLPEETNVKQLCARIDLQIRRLLEGSKNVAERLMRDALFFVASAESEDPAVKLLKHAYRLETAIPVGGESTVVDAEWSASGKLRDAISVLEESWNKFCAGSASALPLFRENAAALSVLTEQLGHTDYRRLVQAIVAAANWLAEDAVRHSDALAMEIATAILLTQNAQANFHRLGADFAHQVDVTVARIHACIAGNPLQAGSEVPLLDEMSRQAQEKLLIGQVAKEIQNNLVQIEQVLDSFFRDAEKRGDLSSLVSPFHQIIGAMVMLRQDSAMAALQDCLKAVKRFSEPDYVPLDSDFEELASQLSMLGFFVEAMQHGADDYDSFVRQMQIPSRGADELVDEAAGVSVEQEVVQTRLETHALLSALKEQPEDAGLREEIRQNLATLKNDADLVADAALGEQTKAILTALDGGAEAAPQLEQAMAMLKPEPDGALQPSKETLQLSQASREEIDAELLAIFLEEANEVLGTIDSNLHCLKQFIHAPDCLVTIRRSFHTLKGSGRMVGLKDLGEAAWAIEQTLNLWLRLELEVSPALVGLLDQAQEVFGEWVAFLEARTASAPDPRGMISLAEALRSGTEEIQPVEPPTAVEVLAVLAVPDEPAEIALPELDQEEEAQSAEVIHIDFASAQPVEHQVDRGVDSDVPTMPAEGLEAPEVPVADVLPLIQATEVDATASSELEEKSPDDLVPESRQQRIRISPALFEIFSDEAKTYLHTLRRELPALEGEGVHPTPHDMYRAAHTLAGISATVGLTPVNQLGYALEHALMRRDHSDHAGSVQALGVIRRTVGELELMFSALSEQRDIEIPAGLIEELDSLYPASVVTSPSHVLDKNDLTEAAPAASDEESATLVETRDSAAVIAPVLPNIPLLRDEIDEQLLPIFLEEAVDLNQGIAAQLRVWRSEPANAEVVRILQRLLHTLKGSARMAGAMNLGEITHALETRVDQVSRVGTVLPDVIDEVETAFESIRQIIERLQRGESLEQPVVTPSENVAGLDSSGAIGQKVGQPTDRVMVERRADRTRLVDAEAEPEAAQQQATLRVRANVIDRLVNEAGELSIARSRIEGEMRSLKESLLDLTENVIRLRRQLREIEIQAESQMQSRTAVADEKHSGFDPLEFDRFTRFQELTRMMAESVNDVATVQQNLLKNLDDANAAIIAQARLNREVQQELMSVRMVPFSSLADRMYRIVRQTSKELNKRANLEIRGGQVELDRSVLDKIAAPLEHMLRNAIAHGLESREERIARGKPEIGDVSLSLMQEGNEIILILSDDGSGLDYERIRARALAAGLLTAGQEAGDDQLADLIFTPGFSTAEEISQIAGRGVGMDVVRTEIGSLGGRIEISSATGQGTEFRMIIPLTLAVTKALLVRAGNKSYAIPSSMIEQVLDLKETALNRIRDARSAEWMGHHYAFSYLPHLLGDPGALPEQHRQYWVLLLRSGARRIAVLVDELLGNQEIVVKNIGPQLARVIGVDGATVLGNGQVVLILNPVALSTRAPVEVSASPTGFEVHGTVPELDEPVPATLPTVMVVDDSLTVRKITGRLLAREGYQVLVAKDGVEALEQLLDVVPDVMLVDIEMPRMDGFDLTRNIRADARLKNIPIIMITSRTADKHRNYAFEIGVNQYLGKPYQEEELLRLVAEFVAQRRQLS